MGERYVIKDRWIFDTKLNKNIHSIDCYEEKNVLDIMNGQNERIAELKAENEELQQQLKDNTKQVCEKIREKLMKYAIQKPNKDYSVITIVDNRLDFLIDQIEKGE